MRNQERPEVKNQRVRGMGPLPIRIRPDRLELARKEEQEQKPRQQDLYEDIGELRGVYIISVAARMLEMHPQTLRKYERLGLIRPFRTIGMLRLYSEDDIAKLRLIRYLEDNLGLNLAGVEFILNMLSQLLDMRQRLSQMAEAEQLFSHVEKELDRLYRRLNLPLEE